MERIAFQVGGLTIYWYGVFVSLGFILAYLFMHWRVRKTDIPKQKVSDLCFAAMIGGIVGARFFYVLLNFDQYSDDLWEIIRIDHGGLVFYGGFFGAVATLIYLIKKNNLNLPETADLLGLALPLGQAFGRIGCFINGCCFGSPSNSKLSIHYSSNNSVLSTQIHQHLIPPDALEPLAVFPVQLVQSGTNLAIWFSMLLISSRLKYKGQLFSLYLILYSMGRFMVEFKRGDYLERYIGLTISQIICILLFPFGILLFYKAKSLASKKGG